MNDKFICGIGSAMAFGLIALICYMTRNTENRGHEITLFSGGKEVGHWISKGQVENTHSSSYFYDAETGKMVEISGTFISK